MLSYKAVALTTALETINERKNIQPGITPLQIL